MVHDRLANTKRQSRCVSDYKTFDVSIMVLSGRQVEFCPASENTSSFCSIQCGSYKTCCYERFTSGRTVDWKFLHIQWRMMLRFEVSPLLVWPQGKNHVFNHRNLHQNYPQLFTIGQLSFCFWTSFYFGSPLDPWYRYACSEPSVLDWGIFFSTIVIEPRYLYSFTSSILTPSYLMYFSNPVIMLAIPSSFSTSITISSAYAAAYLFSFLSLTHLHHFLFTSSSKSEINILNPFSYLSMRACMECMGWQEYLNKISVEEELGEE